MYFLGLGPFLLEHDGTRPPSRRFAPIANALPTQIIRKVALNPGKA
jgi:hypothetical protein